MIIWKIIADFIETIKYKNNNVDVIRPFLDNIDQEWQKRYGYHGVYI